MMLNPMEKKHQVSVMCLGTKTLILDLVLTMSGPVTGSTQLCKLLVWQYITHHASDARWVTKTHGAINSPIC